MSKSRELLIDWVSIPHGTLLRGTPADEIDDVTDRHAAYGLPRSFFAKEAPRSEVVVASFAISRTPVAIETWRTFCATAGWPQPSGDQRRPVDGLAWWEASAFCEWAADVTGLAVRLPTETEWERAARGDDAREYPWGDTFDRGCANLAELGVGHALPVGALPRGASPFGVLDLAGNVDEWTATEYAPYPGAPTDVPPLEPQAVDRHITRGGSYRHCMDLARCARRHGSYVRGEGAGFRLAMST